MYLTRFSPLETVESKANGFMISSGPYEMLDRDFALNIICLKYAVMELFLYAA
jgi:hypothetical protein